MNQLFHYLFSKPEDGTSWITSIWCRIQGHPKGPIWFAAGQMDPDMHCKTCGDDLG